MKLSSNSIAIAVVAAFFISCTATKSAQKEDSKTIEDTQYVFLDTMVVRPDTEAVTEEIPLVYQGTATRTWDLLHTKLDLSFDWKNEKVMGTATLTLTPLIYKQSSLTLDAVNFNIGAITSGGQAVPSYENTGRQLVISLGKEYTKGEELEVEISYDVQPQATPLTPGGAITSNKGLFFIDPQDTIPGVPQQIWSQGETQYNSQWYPTFDAPNERGTQEIILTVSDTMMTLSNGLLVSSVPVGNGMRKDHWKLDLPHAPYLAMIAVGQWDKETDYWRGRTVDYYVDPGFGPSARTIFQHTPEMLEFFSTRLGYDYVWPKYAQIIVKDFVTGAMENTTAVTFGDFVQFNKDDVIDEGVNDYIVAHELFHQWFGDLVTCESWSNLTLNEGFANYGEYLWTEHKFGREQADLTRLNELSGYFNQAENEVHPLIDYYYVDQQDMFDAHSYNKGGLVLHMLRAVVGDDAFFAALQFYLKHNAYSAVEVADLRLAFEEVTGLDLQWFFDQWYFGIGHPVLNITHQYNAETHQLGIDIQQTQKDLGYTEKFILPIEVAFIDAQGQMTNKEIRLERTEQHFEFNMDTPPAAVVIDPRDLLLAVVHHDIDETEYGVRTMAPLSINHRLSAFRMLESVDSTMIDQLLADDSYTMRLLAINHLIEMGDTDKIFAIARQDTNAEVKYFIMDALRESAPQKAKTIAIQLLDQTDKVPMIYSALLTVAEVDIDEAMHWLTHFEDNDAEALFVARASIAAREKHVYALDSFFTERAAKISDDYLEEYIGAIALFLSSQPLSVQQDGLNRIDSPFFLQTPSPEYRRFFLITGLLQQYAEEEDELYEEQILQTINHLYQQETSEYLKGILKEGLGDLLED